MWKVLGIPAIALFVFTLLLWRLDNMRAAQDPSWHALPAFMLPFVALALGSPLYYVGLAIVRFMRKQLAQGLLALLALGLWSLSAVAFYSWMKGCIAGCGSNSGAMVVLAILVVWLLVLTLVPHFPLKGTRMDREAIAEIGIDDQGRLYVSPRAQEFPYIYREAMEVDWDHAARCLYVPPAPRAQQADPLWWFQRILAAAREQGYELHIAQETKWQNIPQQLKEEITSSSGISDSARLGGS
jgi:Integron Cassette Protein Hfx_Cass5